MEISIYPNRIALEKFPRANILLIYDRNFKWSNSIYVSI